MDSNQILRRVFIQHFLGRAQHSVQPNAVNHPAVMAAGARPANQKHVKIALRVLRTVCIGAVADHRQRMIGIRKIIQNRVHFPSKLPDFALIIACAAGFVD